MTNDSPTYDAVLFASYGTSSDEARAASIDPVARFLRAGLGAGDAEAPDASDTEVHDAGEPEGSGAGTPAFVEAYTSAKARRVLARRGVVVPDVSEALHALARSGARRVLVVPGHLVYGEVYAQVQATVRQCRFLFSELVLAEPLLSTDEDLQVVARALDAHYPRREGEALVIVAHGSDDAGVGAGSTYASLALHLRELGRGDAYVGAMRCYPTLDVIRALVAQDREREGIRTVRLLPLMLTAAAHASRDIAGDRPGSWRVGFEADGFDVEAELVGLGALPEIQQLYLDHARKAWQQAEAQAESHAAGSQRPSAGDAHLRFPLFVDLAKERCVVVGLGSIGLRRARALVSFGAEVVAFDPSPRESAAAEAGELGVRLERREWRPSDLEGARLVVVATATRTVNAVIGRAARRLGIPVSVADSAEESTFFFPAICRSERLVAGITSGGGDHTLVAHAAASVREALAAVDVPAGD